MKNTDALRGWDGYSRAGQAAYDRHFQFEMDMSDAIDIVQNPDPEIYTPEQIENARAMFEKYSK